MSTSKASADPCRAAIAAIEFALRDSEPKAFLEAWLHGDYEVIRREWPEAPQEVFEAMVTPENVIDMTQALQQRATYRGRDVSDAFARYLGREPQDEELQMDRAFWFASGFQAGFSRAKEGPTPPQDRAVPYGAVETVDVVAVRDGEEVLLGSRRLPPSSKIRDVARSYVDEVSELFELMCRALRDYVSRLEQAGAQLGPMPKHDPSQFVSVHCLDKALWAKLQRMALDVCAQYFPGQDPNDSEADASLALGAMTDMTGWMVRQGWDLKAA